MGTTSRFGLRYPEQTDEVDVPTDMAELASDTDSWLSRAFVCTSSTRPTGVADGFLIYESDTGLLLVRDDPSWVGTGSGGGGGGSSGGGRWSAGSTAQSIPNTSSGPGTIVAFGTEVTPPAATQVTRSAEGAGHKFELLTSGVWACSATVRVQSAATAGEISVGIWADLDGVGGFNHNVAHDGARREGLARTLNPAATTYLPSGAELVAYIFNGTGTTRTLEPNNGAWVHLDLWLVG